MNIYDDLLKIIEEAKVHNIHQDYFGCVQFEQALERAKKVEELLGLYKQYYNKIPIGKSMYKVELEIERLEEELEELK